MRVEFAYRRSIKTSLLTALSLIVLATSLAGCVVAPGRGGYRVEPLIAFRSPNENPRQLNWPHLVSWLAEQFDANRPWDEIARAMITATGRDDENGAVVFALAEEAKAPEMAGEVSRVFLGIQIQCAECHDHPSDPWKRQQFHEFAAFFAGLKSRPTSYTSTLPP